MHVTFDIQKMERALKRARQYFCTQDHPTGPKRSYGVLGGTKAPNPLPDPRASEPNAPKGPHKPSTLPATAAPPPRGK